MRTYATLVMLGLACGVVAVAQETPPPAPAPKISVDPPEWNFSEVWQGDPLKKEITIKNAGDAVLEINNVKTSCGCTTPTKPKSPLMPGETATMSIAYDSKGHTGNTNQTITLETNDPQQPSVVIRVIGHVKPLYELTPKELVFGELFQTMQAERKVEIANRSGEKMHLELKPGQDTKPFQLELKELEPGTRYELTARTVTPMRVGRERFEVVLKSTWERLPELPGIILYGMIYPPVRVEPDRLFLSKGLGVPQTKPLKVSYAPDHPAEVVAVRGVPDTIKATIEKAPATPDTKPAGGSVTIQVVLPPGDQIPDNVDPVVEIETTSKDPDFHVIKVPVQVVSATPRVGTAQPLGNAPGGAPPTTQPAPRR